MKTKVIAIALTLCAAGFHEKTHAATQLSRNEIVKLQEVGCAAGVSKIPRPSIFNDEQRAVISRVAESACQGYNPYEHGELQRRYAERPTSALVQHIAMKSCLSIYPISKLIVPGFSRDADYLASLCFMDEKTADITYGWVVATAEKINPTPAGK